eukprot:SAG11_NODE_7934_length_1079_cov_1.506122_1_plen_242_part_00
MRRPGLEHAVSLPTVSPLTGRVRVLGNAGMCLPTECSAQDVKIFTGYYYFWLKCGGELNLPSHGGGGGGGGFRRALQGSAADLLKLAQCGEKECPWPPPPPPRLPPACEQAVNASCADPELGCKACIDLHYLEWKSQCPDAPGTTKTNVTDGFCGIKPDPTKFDPKHCYSSICPSSGGGYGAEEEYGAEQYDSAYEDAVYGDEASATRRQLQHHHHHYGSDKCPNLETGPKLGALSTPSRN